jgi:hypothetical protein
MRAARPEAAPLASMPRATPVSTPPHPTFPASPPLPPHTQHHTHSAINEARGAHAQYTLRLMLVTTLVVWSLFPCVWGLTHLGFLSPAAEHTLWGVADYSAKVVFSSHLWQKNFVTIEQRKVCGSVCMSFAKYVSSVVCSI